MTRTAWCTAGILLCLLLSGCTGSNGSPQSDPGTGPDDAGDGEVGALQGSVYDDERRPIEGANVGLFPLALNATSDANGRFLFRQIPVGDYVLQVTKSGYHNATYNASVAPRRTTSMVLLVVPLPADVAYHMTFPFAGLQRCMVYTNVFLGSCSFPYTAATGSLRDRGVNVSQLPPDVVENRYRYNFSAERDHTAIVSELIWRAQTDASRYYVLQLGCAWYNAAVDDCVRPGETTWAAENTYVKIRGVSPLRVEWSAHESKIYREQSTWIMSRAYLSGPADRPAGIALDQRIEMFNTVFYGAEPPEYWSVAAPS